MTDERYVVVVMPWKAVNMHGKSGENDKHVTLAESVHEIISCKESVDKERERREAEREKIERKRAEYYEAHMRSETERLNNWVDWYEVKLNEIREAPVDEKLKKLGRLYRISERNKHNGVTITSAGVINPVNYPVYPPELKIPEYNDNEENPFCDAPTASSLPAGCIMHQSIPSTNILPGRPPGFCTLLLPRGRDLYLMTFPGAGFLHIHKITFSTVKKYTFTQLASYLHALHRQFRLSILA